MAPGTTKRAKSSDRKFTRKLPREDAERAWSRPMMPETLPRPLTGTWSGSVAFAAARTAFSEACTRHHAMRTTQTESRRR